VHVLLLGAPLLLREKLQAAVQGALASLLHTHLADRDRRDYCHLPFARVDELHDCDDVKLEILDGVSARKALLILLVMTLHSFSEGIGIGVSFSANSATQLGMLITTTLAVHNVPEGFAISVVLVSRGMSVFGAVLWSITTSLPQPVMAILGHQFVDSFALVQPAGLGFAAGAMLWVAFAELFVEALEACGLVSTASCGVATGLLMWMFHGCLHEG